MALLGGPILCQIHHNPYVCSSCSRATLSSGDGTDSRSRVSVAKRTWEPAVASCLVLSSIK
jgi:hypothetical protein